MSALSLHLIVKDEEELLGKLLAHVTPYVGEMVIVDTGSLDGTVAVAREFTRRVYTYDLNGDFGAARNFALERAMLPWILHLDADEWPTMELLTYLHGFTSAGEIKGVDGLSIVRHNLVGGQEIGKATWERHVRVFRSKLRFMGRLHEKLMIDPTRIMEVPKSLILRHYKTAERQERQNQFYMRWEEQRAIVRGRT
jgi:glycosyltransferase involved in cell wall biosynthesis